MKCLQDFSHLFGLLIALQWGSSVHRVLGVYGDVKQQSILTQDRPVLGEISFQQLLAAAYVVQQRNERVIPREAGADHVQTLVHIAETQNLIQSCQLDLPAATMLIAKQVEKITKASGVAIGIVEGDELVYQATRGTADDEMGSRVPLASCLSAYCLHSGQILQCSDAKRDTRLRYEHCRLRYVQSLIAVPVYHEGKIAGVLEVRFAEPNSVREHDARSSQLMAGLVSDAIARASGLEWKQSLATERASMLEVLDRIKPQLERLVGPFLAPGKDEAVPSSNLEAEPSPSEVCRGCGHRFEEEEYFCGACGTARQEISSRGDIQSKLASLWHMQQAQTQKTNNLVESPIAVRDTSQGAMPPSQQNLGVPSDKELAATHAPSGGVILTQARAVPTQKSPWTSAASARRWLEELNAQERPGRAWVTAQWDAHRGNVYVAVAAFLLLFAIFDWGFGPTQIGASGQPSATKTARKTKQAQLTLSEKVLVSLGIAELPPSPTYVGNPQTQVWVDLHTALYYCPGADLYGKTEGGKLTTQRDAQQDQFEPASRRACD